MPSFTHPLQAGSEDILKAMNRKYTIKEFREFIEWAYKMVPDICIGTDVIVGYPGEEKHHFDETVANIMTLPLHYLHVFSYSERKLARSRKLKNINPAIIKERSQILRNISKKHAINLSNPTSINLWKSYLNRKKMAIGKD